MKNDDFVNILRYLAIPIAYIIGFAAGSLLGFLIRLGTPELSFSVLFEIIGWSTEGVCVGVSSVWCGVFVAPNHKPIVGTILATVTIIFTIVMLCNFNSWIEWFFYVPLMYGSITGAMMGAKEDD